jgi:hypothetical protein
MKEWYNNLYRGERYIVNILIGIVVLALLSWCTRDMKERINNKPIILYRK